MNAMDFRKFVREQLPSVLTPREPKILEELAPHLEDLYREQRSAGLDHDEALSRAIRTLTSTPRPLVTSEQPAGRRPSDCWTESMPPSMNP
jgi:hypothetical protein